MTTKTNKAQTILSIVVGFLVLHWIFKVEWLFYVSLIVGVLGLLSGAFAAFVEKIWLKLAEILGRINGTILLSIIFFVFLTPIAWLMKLFKGGDQLRLKKQDQTVFQERNHKYSKEDLENIW